MKKSTTILLIALALAGAVIGVCGYAWYMRQRANTYYTDADTIQETLENAYLRDILWTPAVDLGPRIDTAADEVEPAWSADGSTIYFVRRGEDGRSDIWHSRRDGPGWSEPQPFEAVNTEAFDELGPEPARDGSAFYFCSDRPGGSGGLDLWVIRRARDGWSAPVNLGPAVNSQFHDHAPGLSADGATLYFASNRPDGGEGGGEREADEFTGTLDDSLTRHDFDLYSVAITAGGSFETPEPVAALNTSADEAAPALSPFNDFLYFSSNRAGGFGGYDLYRARLRGGVIETPRNLGDEINTAHDELDGAIDRGGFALYFASDRPYAHRDLDADDEFNLFYSTSREVFRETAAFDWAALWEAIAPALLWLLIAALLLALLAYLLRRLEYKRLSLLARCLLASLLVHFLVMFLLSLWAVTTGLSQALRERSGIQVALTTTRSSDSLAQQVRGNLTEVPVETDTAVEATPRATTVELTQAAATMQATSVEEQPEHTTDASTATTQRAADAAPRETEPLTTASTAREVATASMDDVATPSQMEQVAAEEAAAALPAPAQTQPHAAPNRTARELASAPATRAPPSELTPETAKISTPTDSTATRPEEIAEAHPQQERQIAQAPSRAVETIETTSEAIDVQLPAASESALAAVEEASGEIAAPTSGVPAPSRTSTAAGVEQPRRSRTISASPAAAERSVSESTLVASPRPALRESTAELDSMQLLDLPLGGPQMVMEELAVATPLETGTAADAEAVAEATLAVESGAIASRAPSQRAAEHAPARHSPTAATAPGPLADDAIIETAADTALATDALAAPVDAAVAERAEVALPAELHAEVDTALATDALPELEEDAVRMTRAETGFHIPAATDGAAAPSRAPPQRARPSQPLAADIDVDPLVSEAIEAAEAQPRSTLAELLQPESLEGAQERTANRPVAIMEMAALERLDFPSIEQVLESLSVPTEKALETNPLEQRAAQRRVELVEERGGDEATEDAVAMALRWLAEHQSADGRWDADGFDPTGTLSGTTNARVDVAITALSLLAFLGADYTHLRESEYQDTVQRAIDFILAEQQRSGAIMGRDGGETMYTHGIAAIALAEAFAMTSDPQLIEPVMKAVEFIDQAANREYGGWRYAPGQVGDTSVTGWQVMALASAARGNIPPPTDALQNAARWIEMVRHPQQRGRYAYQPGRQYTEAMTAEAMFVRQLLGVERSDADMQASADYLLDNLPDWDTACNTYYWYYGTLAMFHYQGPAWEDWNRALKRELIENQQLEGEARGSWEPNDQWAEIGGRVYQTAICALCLEVYYRYDPMYSPEDVIDAIGTIRGQVVDVSTREPIEAAVVVLDVPDGPTIRTRSDAQGMYRLRAPEVSEFFAVSASAEGYSPETVTASIRELRGRNMRRDFELAPLREDIIAIEDVPQVHHLGNDLFEGAINSQFQRDAEGTLWRTTFDLGDHQLPPRYNRAEIHLLIKGAQARNRIRINNQLIPQRLDEAPRDGSYGEFSTNLPMELLLSGRNEVSIQSVNTTGDLDDFEFVNVRIILFQE